jgi:predicted secreted protein
LSAEAATSGNTVAVTAATGTNIDNVAVVGGTSSAPTYTDILANGSTGVFDVQTYNFGKEVNPLAGEKLAVSLDVTPSGQSKEVHWAEVDYKATYKNNTEAGTATVTITIPEQTVTVTLDDTTTKVKATVKGTIVKDFDIAKFDLDDASTVAQNTVSATWTGSTISIDKSKLPLTTRIYADDNDTQYTDVVIPTSAYTVSKVVTEDDTEISVTESGSTLSFSSTDVKPGDSLKVKFAAADTTNYEVTDGTSTYGVIKVEKANWSAATVTVEDQTSVGTPNVTVSLNGVAIDASLQGSTNNASLTTASSDFTDDLEDKAYAVRTEAVDGDSSIVRVVITPNDAYFTNAKAVTYYANIGKNIQSVVTGVALAGGTNSFAYTGAEIKPEVKVTAGTGITLTEGVDYEVVYSNNTKVGTASYYVKGIGAYAGKTNPRTFTITTAKLADTTVTATDVTYETTLPTVADLAKALTVKNGDVELVYGTDYTVALVGTVKDGENTVKILPSEKNTSYIGSKTVTVNVVKVADISTAEIATIANVAYTGEAQTPALTVTLGDKTLVQDTDYTVEYTNNTEVGCATATITGIGAYTGTNARNFVIVPQQVTGLKAIKKTATTLKLQFNAVKGADGYKIYDAETGKAIASVSTQNGADVLKKTITGLNAGETRKYKVRAYKIVNGTKRYAEFSAVYTKATAKK